MTAAVQIVPMAPEHLTAIAEIERACFSEPWSEAALAAELEKPGSCFVVALCGGVAGYAGMQTVLDEGYVTNVAVAGPLRRRGVGRALTEALLAEGGRRGLSFITLEVRESNAPARAMYAGLGFQVVGRRRRFYRLPDEDAVLMTRFFSQPVAT